MALAQPPAAAAKTATTWHAPHNADGQPDLEGIWDTASITPLERPAALGTKAYYTKEEAAHYEKTRNFDLNRDRRDGDATADLGRAYNDSWFDRGDHLGSTLRTSRVIDPPNGRFPAFTPEAKKKFDEFHAWFAANPADSAQDRTLFDRCLVFSQTGPPLIPGNYNNMYQIVQTSDSVTILSEMNHQARTVPLVKPDASTSTSLEKRDKSTSTSLEKRDKSTSTSLEKRDKSTSASLEKRDKSTSASLEKRDKSTSASLEKRANQWMGSGRAHFEGDTLVIETANIRFNQQSHFGTQYEGMSDENLRVTERFTRTAPGTVIYQATVVDPTVYVQPWTIELPMAKTDGPIYEYACHEGNYGLAGILSGERAREKANLKPTAVGVPTR